ncbi:MAG: hypothetical protein AB9833_02190 [Bacteroidales bacterium]
MKINFDKFSNTLTIQDDYKRINILTGTSLIICMFLTGWNIFRHYSEEFDFEHWFWMISALIVGLSVIQWLVTFFKTTYQSQFKVGEIEFIKFRRFRKWSTFYISMRNGKRREVMLRLDQDDYEIMVERCNNFGIEMKHHKNR